MIRPSAQSFAQIGSQCASQLASFWGGGGVTPPASNPFGNHPTLYQNLVSYWKLDEASGTRADSHGSNNLADNNTVLATTGKIGNAGNFVAANSEYLSIADNPSLSITGDLSISFWMWTTNTQPAAAQAIVGKHQSVAGGRSYSIYLLTYFGNGVVRFAVSSDGNSNASGNMESGALLNSTWYHIVGTYQAGVTQKLYVNAGTPIDKGSTEASIIDNASQFAIGAFAGGANFFNGIVDEVGIWNKVLTADEVTSLFAAGAGLTY